MSRPSAFRPAEVVFLIGVALWSLAMAALAVAGGAQHDYVSYIGQWRLALSGGDPWSTRNAYGPVHTGLAVLLPLGDLAPKLLMVGALLAANFALALQLARVRPRGFVLVHYAIMVIANIAVISLGVIYGLNDALVVALMLAAVLLRMRQAYWMTGIMLGLAVLLKYYPLLIIPVFALDGRRLRLDIVAAALLTIIAGLAATFALFGDEWLAPLRFGAERVPKLLSILSALRSAPWLVGGPDVLDWLIRNNGGCVMVVAALSFLVAWWRRIAWLEASVLALLAILLVYKVGHPQFFLPWLFMVAALPLVRTPSADRLAALCWPMALFLSVFQWGYAFGSDHYREVLGEVRLYAGFVAFPLGLATLAAYFGGAGRVARTTVVPAE